MQFVSGNPACSRLKKRNAPDYDDACGESRFETGGRVPEKSVMNLNDYKTECCAELTLNSYNMDTNIWGGTSPGLLDRIKFLDEYFVLLLVHRAVDIIGTCPLVVARLEPRFIKVNTIFVYDRRDCIKKS